MEKKIIVNGKELEYHGQPLQAFVFDGEAWGGRSNFIEEGVSGKNISCLRDTSNCFWWIKNWILLEGDKYGYVLDYYNQVVYYDKIEALDYLQKDYFLVHGLNDYFVEFIQKDFLEPAA
ncbi:MAG: hypothetical protein WCK37_01535 [Candidatus Falkowbacteria bacterium]